MAFPDRYIDRYIIDRNINTYRLIITILLSTIGVVIELLYVNCSTICRPFYGDIFGIELPYIGIIFMFFVALFALLKRDRYLLALLSAGIGVETYLISFQAWHKDYCAYCLAFAIIVALQFLINIKTEEVVQGKKWLVLFSFIVGLILFFVCFEGHATYQYL